MEVNGACMSFNISESARAYFNCFYSVVAAFGRAIADLGNNGIADFPLMCFDDFGGLLDRDSRRLRMAKDSHRSQPFRALR